MRSGPALRAFIKTPLMRISNFDTSRLEVRGVKILPFIQTLLDVCALSGSFVLAYLLRFDFSLSSFHLSSAGLQLLLVVSLQLVALRVLNIHRFIWRYTSIREMNGILRALMLPLIPLLLLRLSNPEIISYFVVPISIVLLDYLLAVGGVLGIRVVRREIYDWFHRFETQKKGIVRKPAVILIGAGRAGVMTLTESKRHGDIGFDVVGFVDDDPRKKDAIINGIPVLGTTSDLPALVRAHHVDHVIITIAEATRDQFKGIIDRCNEIPIKVKTIPGLYELLQDRVQVSRIRDIQIEDLLGRSPVNLDEERLIHFLKNKSIMVTGAGGSIGSVLSTQLASLEPSTLVLVERSEYALFSVEQQIRQSFPDVNIEPVLKDVCDTRTMANVFRHYEPQVVFHAAAHKHVPLVENNAPEALKNNSLGTYEVANLAGKFGCETFVLISTDKAVNPTSVMGATKRVAEMVIQELNKKYETRYVAVRFGNVIGSTGSVIPTFRKQIKQGGPVTVTHPDMVRFFMTIPEASQLVLQAGTLGKGGEVFILDMGEPVKILDLAKETIKLSGLTPGVDIDIEYVGMRPGEKLYEELHTEEEEPATTVHSKIMVSRSSNKFSFDLDQFVEAVERLAIIEEDEQIRIYLKDLIPEATLGLEESETRVATGSTPLIRTTSRGTV